MVSLTAEVSLKAGPLLLNTMVKHYFDRIRRDASKKSMVQLRRDELAYDEAFSVIKKFLDTCQYHSVEEVQAFSNAPTPSPPWVHVVKVVVPMSCCDEAATLLIKVLGGEEHTRRVVGGVKWWQVRGIHGIDGQWITARKDWQEAKRRYKMQQKNGDIPSPDAEPAHYESDMDDMRCILYLHGGGYYMGSVDQTRYSIQRFARKINGRVFAINYRLAPQYPFPCALQDALASYLYLINPPPEATHRPVNPKHLIISGDSAGGGMTIALLQMIRDLGLPPPAGGVLISPWSDLTHSFPSVHTNTETDVIPYYGLSMAKPSLLWPPPSQDVTQKVHASLRSRVKKTMKMDFDSTATIAGALSTPSPATQGTMPINVGATAPLPSIESQDHQTIKLVTAAGETLEINRQLHLYTENRLLKHPLISPCLSYMGGLPPLHFIVSDKECLRDEIIYTAHKAAYPERFPISEDAKKMYPVLNGIEERCQATPVHLQLYDDTAHVIPILFSFTTPGKYCFRAMANFVKHVTGMPPTTPPRSGKSTPKRASSVSTGVSEAEDSSSEVDRRIPGRKSSSGISALHRKSISPKSSPPLPPLDPARQGSTSSDVGGPRFGRHDSESSSSIAPEEKMAGEPGIYIDGYESGSWDGTMIRERVSTKGVLRPMEPEEELDGMKVPASFIGQMSELDMRRFLEGYDKFDRKFAHTTKALEKMREHQMQRARKDIARSMTLLEKTLEQQKKGEPYAGIRNGVIPSTGGWSWAWALEDENPPPSSIASRRDTDEARRLAKIADLGFFQDEHTVTGNNLWQTVINFLTVTPDKDKVAVPPSEEREGVSRKKEKSKFSSTLTEKKIEGVPGAEPHAESVQA